MVEMMYVAKYRKWRPLSLNLVFLTSSISPPSLVYGNFDRSKIQVNGIIAMLYSRSWRLLLGCCQIQPPSACGFVILSTN